MLEDLRNQKSDVKSTDGNKAKENNTDDVAAVTARLKEYLEALQEVRPNEVEDVKKGLERTLEAWLSQVHD